MYLIKPCWFCADAAQVSYAVLQNWKHADLHDGSEHDDLPLFSHADRLQLSTSCITECNGLSPGSGNGGGKCISSSAHGDSAGRSHARFEPGSGDQFKHWGPKPLSILMTLFYILDLPSGETQYKGTRVGRAL